MKTAHFKADLAYEHIKDNETLIQYLDRLIDQAYHLSVSDIHIEPARDHYRLRYRHDGILYDIIELPDQLTSRLITRLKVIAQLDIAERRLPQDGSFQINLPSQEVIDVRISICPMQRGEKIVLRLANHSQYFLSLDHLGLNDTQKKMILEKIYQSQGLILITGPTGCGKTSTLYSILQQLNRPEKNIITIEDPIEIQLAGINQVHLHPKLGLSFATVLRSILRQDPDIIMIGEIRDPETAEMAIQAAQTGHLVLSTLHTNNTIETISRLRLMGCKSYHLANAISLIVAQRLVRCLCPYCESHKGCNHCYQGFLGRTGIFECLAVNDNIISHLMNNADSNTILQSSLKDNFISLKEAGIEKVQKGNISMTELLRIL